MKTMQEQPVSLHILSLPQAGGQYIVDTNACLQDTCQGVLLQKQPGGPPKAIWYGQDRSQNPNFRTIRTSANASPLYWHYCSHALSGSKSIHRPYWVLRPSMNSNIRRWDQETREMRSAIRWILICRRSQTCSEIPSRSRPNVTRDWWTQRKPSWRRYFRLGNRVKPTNIALQGRGRISRL